MAQSKLLVSGTSAVQYWSRQWKPRPPKPETPDLLHSLPPELRNAIYGMVVPATSHLFWPALSGVNDILEPPLLMVAKYIRQEASPMFYGQLALFFRVPKIPGSFKRAAEKWHSIVATCGPQPVKRLFIWFESSFELEDVLDDLWFLVKLIYDTGFEPDPTYKPGDCVRSGEKAKSIASGKATFSTGKKSATAAILGRAVVLGRRARAESWSEKKLAERFSIFVRVARSERKKWPAWL